MHEKVVVLDFGGQYAHLIANRIRRLGVYSEIQDAEMPADQLKSYKGIILSGGPQSVYDKDSPKCDPAIFNLGVPVLGICYGHQLMQQLLGGKVVPGKTKEYGLSALRIKQPVGIFRKTPSSIKAWMSHGDTVEAPAGGFEEIAATDDCKNSALMDPKRRFFGLQFHPEVTHTEHGMDIFDQFLAICKVTRDWSIEQFIEEEIKSIKKKIGDKKVFLLVSGGVDSSVCFALLEKALGKKRVYGLCVDHGLMRKDEAGQVKKYLAQAGFENLHVVDKSEEFLSALTGKIDPEEKRTIIGDLFWKVKEDEAERLELNPDEWIMGQGTIYPDTIETGGTKHASKIKTHHNRVDLMQEMINAGKVIEPIAQLYKDEVRELGEKLGLPHAMVWRHPFPGPGLGVRILCSGEEKTVEFKSGSDYHILPIKSVGVQGDFRTYRHPALLMASAKEDNERTATDLVNSNPDINRAVTLVGGNFEGKAAKASVKKCFVTSERVRILQTADDIVTRVLHEMDLYGAVWQFPVVLAPLSFNGAGGESIILRPVESIDAMSASAAKLPWEFYEKVSAEILKDDRVSAVLLDVTNKPPGTIEWE
ncbi:glutamine-hydrolyzing GMP synthase [Candidatus Peregrinibacteria bacterium]|nr:glutamine-hydrolyzing GMP synthase [Candidatus Peregrinibacteria bacterium]